MIKTLFWISLGLVFYTYAGYPLLMALLARLAPRPVRKKKQDLPYAVVIAAYNEEANLRQKVESLARGSLAGSMREIWIGSDGSTDGTAGLQQELEGILQRHGLGSSRVGIKHTDERRGKPSMLNQLLPLCSTEIIVLTDARQEVDREAIAELLANLADPDVVAVSAELVFRNAAGDTADARGAGAYWRYEKFIRRSEARAGSVPGVTGALYAIRKELVKKIPEDTLLDDVWIPMQAVAGGGRCVFEERAMAYDRPTQDVRAEAIRKRRTLAGNAQLMLRHPGWMLPWGHPLWFQFISHKALRIFCPYFMLIAGAGNAILVLRGAGWVYAGTMAGMLLVLALAGLGWVLGRKAPLFLRLPALFVSMNGVAALGGLDAVFGRYRVTWARSGGKG